MSPYIFGERNKIHILNLELTIPMLHQALNAVRDTVAKGGRVLFVGTKPQAAEKIKDAANQCGQYYVNHRWLGGMLTNWHTVNQSIKRLKTMEEELASPGRLTKKEILSRQRERDKLDSVIGGVREMGGLPDILFVIDTNKEDIAIKEANRLNIPVVGVLDSNSNPDGITFPIPGNDDAIRAITLYCELISGAVLDGLQAEMQSVGIDLGSAEEVGDGELSLAVDDTSKQNAKKKPRAKAEAPVKAKAAPSKPVKTESAPVVEAAVAEVVAEAVVPETAAEEAAVTE
jgi:small subunit ribosomal protein S2